MPSLFPTASRRAAMPVAFAPTRRRVEPRSIPFGASVTRMRRSPMSGHYPMSMALGWALWAARMADPRRWRPWSRRKARGICSRTTRRRFCRRGRSVSGLCRAIRRLARRAPIRGERADHGLHRRVQAHCPPADPHRRKRRLDPGGTLPETDRNRPAGWVSGGDQGLSGGAPFVRQQQPRALQSRRV